MAEIKIIKKISLLETIKALPIGGSIELDNKTARTMSVRKTCYKLNKRGYYFMASEKGLMSAIRVTRIK